MCAGVGWSTKIGVGGGEGMNSQDQHSQAGKIKWRIPHLFSQHALQNHVHLTSLHGSSCESTHPKTLPSTTLSINQTTCGMTQPLDKEDVEVMRWTDALIFKKCQQDYNMRRMKELLNKMERKVTQVEEKNIDNNENEIIIKREPLVYTRAWRAVQKNKTK